MSVTWALLAVVSTFLFLVLIPWIQKRRRSHQLFKKLGIPGPEPSFLSGNMSELNRSHPNNVISEWILKYGNVVGYFLGERPYLILNDPDLLKQVLIKDYQNFVMRPFLFTDLYPINLTMIGLPQKRWKEVRSTLSPTFSSGKIKLMSNIISKKVDITLDMVSKRAEKREMFDLYQLLQGLTLDVIADCALAMKTHCQENEHDPFLISVQEFIRNINSRAIILAIMFNFLEKLLMFVGQFLSTAARSTKDTLAYVTHVIDYRRKNKEIKSMDFLQLMLDRQAESEKEGTSIMTDEEIAANAYVFLLAGYETTSTAMAFTFYLLVIYPEIQERLYREVSEAKDSSYESIQSCQYLDQILSESLRMYPPITHFTSRYCSNDYKIGSLVIPKNVNVISPVWDLHHNPSYWKDPYKFDPDRFSPENKSKINSIVYQPFGAGPRNCIGSRFAQLEAKQAIFKLIRRFRFEKCEKTENNIVLRNHPTISAPKNGVWVRAVLRDECF